MKDGHIAAVEFLSGTDDQALIAEARKLFDASGSPMLASRSGLDSAEEPMSEIAAKIAELVAPAS